MPYFKFPNSHPLCGGNSKGQELGTYRETFDQQVKKQREVEVRASLVTDQAESPLDTPYLDLEAALSLLELASERKIPTESSTMVPSNGRVPLSENKSHANISDTDSSRLAGGFPGGHMLDPNTVASTPFGETQAAAILCSANLDQGLFFPLDMISISILGFLTALKRRKRRLYSSRSILITFPRKMRP
ncbi:hypothetical protein L873DRAFT_1788664 [Choiromyces venosus 120613-1]|uniref:Uncharacterized protein n=1 Tax=Choiromyces venosus 120613-1 TaxID=1336337 RepID=A0A3N4JRW9_9PEZI|nr:hypothetical protein L873DRAFT_1788664 [Choiromyces venosus 120613-1]